MNKAWLWNVKTPEKEVKEILRNPTHEKFIHFAALLLARNNNPKMVFLELGRDHFLKYWSRVKKQMKKDKWGAERLVFWQAIYDFLKKKYKAQGISIKKETAKIKITPQQKKVGGDIKQYRRAIGINQAELAKRLGVTQQLISRMEKGCYKFNLEKLSRISEVLGIRLWSSHPTRETKVTSDFYVGPSDATFSGQ